MTEPTLLMAPPHDDRALKQVDWAWMALLFIGTGLLYFQTRHFEFIRFDDPLYVSENWHVKTGLTFKNIRWAMTAVVSSNWHPFTLIVELVIAQMFGTAPAVFHLLNAIIHSGNVALLYLFLRKATGLWWRAGIVAMLWGWHPLRVESVAYISELKDALCGFFWLSGMLAYMRYRRRPNLGNYGLLTGCLILALTSKPMAVTFPAALLLMDYWPLRAERQPWKNLLRDICPLILLCAAACCATIYTQAKTGATGSLRYFPFDARLTNALVSFARYLFKTFVPIHLSVFYPHPAMVGATIPIVQWGSALAMLAAITTIGMRLRRSHPYIIIGWLWFIGTLVPVIGMVQVGEQAMADRYSYIPSIGITVAVVWLIGDGLAQLKIPGMTGAPWAGAAIAVLAVMSWIQIGYWNNEVALFTHANAVTSDNFLARTSLSMSARLAGHIDDAIEWARSAVAACPQNQEAHHAYALALQAKGELKQAYREYALAVKFDSTDADIRNDLATLLSQQNHPGEAETQFRMAISLDPENTNAMHNLALLLAFNGRYEEAIALWKTAVNLAPGNGMYHGWLAEALQVRGDRKGAIEHYQAAWKYSQHNPAWESNLVWLIATDPDSTIEQLDEAVEIARKSLIEGQKGDPGPLDASAAALARTGQFDDAVITAQSAKAAAHDRGNTKLEADIQTRLDEYQQGRSYVIPKLSPASP